MSRSKRTYPSYRASYAKYALESRCQAIVVGDSVNPDGVRIRLAGPVAKIPSLKNEKIWGTNLLRAEAKARLVLATDAVKAALGEAGVPHYEPNVPVFCLVLCSYRGHSFDEDNVATTIKDWLEPRYIRKHDRGWGLGIVPNDKEINVFAIKKTKDAKEPDVTEIYILQLKYALGAREDFTQTISKLFQVEPNKTD